MPGQSSGSGQVDLGMQGVGGTPPEKGEGTGGSGRGSFGASEGLLPGRGWEERGWVGKTQLQCSSEGGRATHFPSEEPPWEGNARPLPCCVPSWTRSCRGGRGRGSSPVATVEAANLNSLSPGRFSGAE